jgi:hypothetical protein
MIQLHACEVSCINFIYSDAAKCFFFQLEFCPSKIKLKVISVLSFISYTDEPIVLVFSHVSLRELKKKLLSYM